MSPSVPSQCSALYLDESLDDEEHSSHSLEVDNAQMTVMTETVPLTTTREEAEELSIDRSMVLQHLMQIGKTWRTERVCTEGEKIPKAIMEKRRKGHEKALHSGIHVENMQ
ncbi:Histone-lysine N-methyltransferase SETMAR, partial [Plecturocebus cupreus]